MGGTNSESNLIIPPAWEALADESLTGPVILLGGPDSGKTSLAFYLLQTWSDRRLVAGMLDCDMGQSSLGLPTTMSLRIQGPQGAVDYAYFTGSTSPRHHMLPTLVGVDLLYRKAQSLSVAALVVDTTGLIDPAQGGAVLKGAEIELLTPCRVIALARGAELNPILRSWEHHPAVDIRRLPISPHVRGRNRNERTAWRCNLWQSYFRQATPTTFPFSELAMIDWLLPTAQKICAFLDEEGLCRGLGRVTYLDRKAQSMTVETPLHSLEDIVALRFGPPRLEDIVLGNPVR